MRLIKTVVLTACVLAAAISTASASAASHTVVKVGPTKLGRVLVDAHGKTLYRWAHDKGSKSTCNGACAQAWPPLIAHGKPSAQAGARLKMLGTSRRKDGRMQVTYAGHPLYYFIQDTKAGQTKGEGLTAFGGRWDPVSTSGAAVRADSRPASYDPSQPLKASVIAPTPGASAGVGGAFTVDVSLEARSTQANTLLSDFTTAFIDPNGPTFSPGPNAAAPGLVVLLSTTPTIPGTPLQGPNTNLAGVFEINDVFRANNRIHTFNSWIITSPGFFGTGPASLTVYAINGTAPAVVTGNEKPISNTVRENFTIAA